MKRRDARKLVNILLLVVTILVLVSGFGIVFPVIVTPLTAGLLGKSVTYNVHIYLWGPFLVLLLIHLYLARK